MFFSGSTNVRFLDACPSIAQRFLIRLTIVVVVALTIALRAPAQSVQTPEGQLGRVTGTVTDRNGDAVAGATVVLAGADPNDRQTVVTGENGSFEFDDVKPAVPYQIIITAVGFAQWTSPAITLEPGEFKLLGGIPLRLATQNTTVQVTYNPEQIATEQFKLEETQRVLGVFPNFYITYQGDNAVPLSTKMKFKLAFRVSVDPVTIAGVAFVSGVKQAANTPHYGQGASGFGERFGATAADGFSDIIIGGAILPSLLHQDPRYFYQGTGTTKSRIRHAMLYPFISKGDNGKYQPNYSSLGGDLASAAISNTYFPKSDRGAGLVFSQFAIGTAERVGASLAQEFVLSKLTHRAGHIQ